MRTLPLRVLHVAVSDQFAGVEQFVLRLATTQARDGHQVWVAGGDPAVLAEPLRSAGVHFAPAPDIRTAVRAIRATDVDVVNSHMTAADIAAVTARVRWAESLVITDDIDQNGISEMVYSVPHRIYVTPA